MKIGDKYIFFFRLGIDFMVGIIKEIDLKDNQIIIEIVLETDNIAKRPYNKKQPIYLDAYENRYYKINKIDELLYI